MLPSSGSIVVPAQLYSPCRGLSQLLKALKSSYRTEPQATHWSRWCVMPAANALLPGLRTSNCRREPITRQRASNNRYSPRQKDYKAAVKNIPSTDAEYPILKREKQKDKYWNAVAEGLYQPLLALNHFIVFNGAPTI